MFPLTKILVTETWIVHTTCNRFLRRMERRNGYKKNFRRRTCDTGLTTSTVCRCNLRLCSALPAPSRCSCSLPISMLSSATGCPLTPALTVTVTELLAGGFIIGYYLFIYLGKNKKKADSDWECFRRCAISSSLWAPFTTRGVEATTIIEFFSVTHTSKNFEGARGRLCSSKRGACAKAQWHSGQSKPAGRCYFSFKKRSTGIRANCFSESVELQRKFLLSKWF